MGLRDLFFARGEDTDHDQSKDQSGQPGRDGARPGIDITPHVRPRAANFAGTYFRVNDTFERVLYLRQWPIEVDPNWLREVFQWPRSIDIALFYRPLPKEAQVRKLSDRVARQKAEIWDDQNKGMEPDEARMLEVEDAQSLRRLLQRNEQKAFEVCLMITVRAETKPELDELTEHLVSHFDELTSKLESLELRQKAGFLSMLPLGRNYVTADDETTRVMQTDAAAYTFPLANADLSHPDGIWYGVNASTNGNIVLDRFLLPSPHSVIVGASGSGKSYFSKLELLRALMHGWSCIVVDPEGEFVRMCEYVGGQYIPLGPNSPYRINPFDFSLLAGNADPDTGELEDVLLAKILSVCRLVGAIKYGDSDLQADEFKLMDSLLRELYAKFGYTQDPRTQVEATPRRMPIMSDLHDALEQYARDHVDDPRLERLASDLANAISPFCTNGIFGALFDQHTNVELTEQLVVFGVQALSQASDKKLLALGMHTVLDYLWSATLTSKGGRRRRLVTIDEAHIMMRLRGSAEFLGDFSRRARKYNVGVTVISQDPSDFFRADRPEGRAVFTNSSMQIILRLQRTVVEALQQQLGLGQQEVEAIARATPGRGLLIAGDDRVLIDLRTSSPAEHSRITTNADEVALIEESRAAQIEAAVRRSVPVAEIAPPPPPPPPPPAGDLPSATAPAPAPLPGRALPAEPRQLPAGSDQPPGAPQDLPGTAERGRTRGGVTPSQRPKFTPDDGR